MRYLLLFIKNHLMQLRRKWLSLPLLLIFPIIIVGLTAVIIITYFSPSGDDEPVKIGLVDLDGSTETQLVCQLIQESSQLGSYLAIHSMSESEALKAIDKDRIASYIVFPVNFTSDLYQGNTTELPIIGNPNQPTVSYMINELMESVARHIRSSQANILSLNYYAKNLGMEDAARNDFVFQQFQEFLFYTIGRDRILSEKEISNQATSSPIQYFIIGGWFIVITIWSFSIFHFLTKENSSRMRNRMRLYGVTELQQSLAKIIVTLAVSFLFSGVSFYFLSTIFETEVIMQDYIRIGIVTTLFSSFLLLSLAIIEAIISSQKLRLLAQSLFTIASMILSGAIIPVIYYPLSIQAFLPYIFSYEALRWLQEILLNDRFYADYIPLLLMNGTGIFVLFGISLWKERVKQ
ncbi:ABC transporter permease [Oceanobacillus rekensis]|uniref:ABC transporter permease n=1 Tax=Oceanobacillus rekensis TaxID=937927 RepID=UPI001FE55467|nr:ABC transporter permease [Oceanobacillus rekensis]